MKNYILEFLSWQTDFFSSLFFVCFVTKKNSMGNTLYSMRYRVWITPERTIEVFHDIVTGKRRILIDNLEVHTSSIFFDGGMRKVVNSQNF